MKKIATILMLGIGSLIFTLALAIIATILFDSYIILFLISYICGAILGKLVIHIYEKIIK